MLRRYPHGDLKTRKEVYWALSITLRRMLENRGDRFLLATTGGETHTLGFAKSETAALLISGRQLKSL